MIKSGFIPTSATLAAACITLTSAAPSVAEENNDGWFPWQKDRYWIYQGTVEYMDPASGAVSRKITWVTRVEDSISTDNWQLALVCGMPHQTAWFGHETSAERELIAMDAEGQIFEIRGTSPEIVFWRLHATRPETLPASLTRPEHLALRRGMKTDDIFGVGADDAAGARPGWHNFGVVEIGDAAPQDFPEQVRTIVRDKVYRMTYRTSPDHTNKTFAPGVGYLEYEYNHHGTPGGCVLKLTETGVDGARQRSAGIAQLGEAMGTDGKPVPTPRLVRDFLSSSATNGSSDRLEAMLLGELDWFGTRKKRDAVLREELDYHQAWPLRSMELIDDVEGQKLADGTVGFRYTLHYQTANLESRKLRSGRVRSEMRLAKDTSGKWRISSLRSLGKAQPSDSEIVMGEKVGPVARDSTVRSLERALGKPQVVTKTVRNELEGIDETISTVFPGSPKEMLVFWEHGAPVRVAIRRKHSPWRSPAGLGVGSSLLSIEEANGGGFGLFGFGWDYGGSVATWKGGRLARQHAAGHLAKVWFRNHENADQKAIEKVLGDKVFSSGHPAIQTLNPVVGGIDFLFPGSPMHIGGLAQGMPSFQIDWLIAAKPEKGKDEFWGADGMFHQPWDFKAHGVHLSMVSEKQDGAKEIGAITVTAPCPLVTERGIGIGSRWDEVALAYADRYSVEGSTPQKLFVAGSVFDGLQFEFENGRVKEIFLGATAE